MKIFYSVTMFRFILVILLASFDVESVFSQSTLVAKTIDTTHQSVVAVFGVEKSGKPWILGSGVLIHPQVILTSAPTSDDLILFLTPKKKMAY